MKNWFSKNFKTIIISAFLIPIITVAIVSISHVTKWYGISNPVTWALYLSVGIEIAALSALAAISADMGKKVYFPFGIVTLVQFIGNIFFAYSYIDINGESFKSWVELTSPLVEFMGVDPNDFVGHKRFLAFFAGGMLPIISLSFLHMLVKFIQNSKNETNTPIEPNTPIVEAKDIVGEVSRVRLSEDDLSVLEEILSNPPKPNEELVKASEEYKKKVDENFDVFVPEPVEKPEEVIEQKIDEPIVEKWEEILPHNLKPMDENSPIIDLVKPEETQTIDEPKPINEPVTEFVPALGDDEVREMVLDEWERKFDLVEDESEEVFTEPAPISSIVEEPIPTPTTEIVVEEIPIVIPIVEEPIVEEVIPEPIVEPTIENIVEEVVSEPIVEEVIPEPIVEEVITETSVESLSETTDEEKKN
jgi:hypothetical protein